MLLKRWIKGQILTLFLASAAWAGGVVEGTSLHGKMLLGYQGWFSCPGDGSGVKRWHHWSRGQGAERQWQIDMWPDMREAEADEGFDTGLFLPDGSPARVFSSYQEKTVLRHFQWMRESGIDGILLQRFVGEIQDPVFKQFRDQVTRHVMKGAERHGRVFALEYDLSATECGKLKTDWMHLVDDLNITAGGRYLRHAGRPVVALWGFGFKDRSGTPDEARELMEWFQKNAPERYRATLIGGVPSGWREGQGDALPGPEWAQVFRSFDVISPWSVGRYSNDSQADRYRDQFTLPDMAEAKRCGREYLPVVFPGFSWKNLHGGPLNQVPRRGGRFYWHQVGNAVGAGATMLKTAMFDEVDEGTAMFKTVPTKADAPVGLPLVTLDADGIALPSDWYLRLAGEASKLLRKEIPPGGDLPIRP
jgi:hypothetical protein